MCVLVWCVCVCVCRCSSSQLRAASSVWPYWLFCWLPLYSSLFMKTMPSSILLKDNAILQPPERHPQASGIKHHASATGSDHKISLSLSLSCIHLSLLPQHHLVLSLSLDFQLSASCLGEEAGRRRCAHGYVSLFLMSDKLS